MKSAAYIKYILALLLFGSNGIVASYILLDSVEIVYLRTLIGSLILALVFVLTKQKAQFWKNKLHFLYLVPVGFFCLKHITVSASALPLWHIIAVR